MLRLFRFSAAIAALGALTSQPAQAQAPAIKLEPTLVLVDASIVGEWRVTELRDARGGGKSIFGETDPEMRVILTAASEMALDAGCNSIAGKVFALGGELEFRDDWIATTKICGDTAYENASRFRAAVGSSAFYVRFVNELHFFDSQGRHVMAMTYDGVEY